MHQQLEMSVKYFKVHVKLVFVGLISALDLHSPVLSTTCYFICTDLLFSYIIGYSHFHRLIDLIIYIYIYIYICIYIYIQGAQ